MQLNWIPNFLTIARIVLVPVFAVAIVRQQYVMASYIFFVAGLSDLADGLLARRFGWQSRLGSLLDPIADKLLFATAMLSLAGQGLVPWWLALLVVGRDLVIMAGATVYNFVIEKLSGASSWIGKLNTAILGLYVLAVLLLHSGVAGMDKAAATLLWLAAGIVVSSGVHYIWSWSKRASHQRTNRETYQ